MPKDYFQKLTSGERAILQKLDSPRKIQDFLDTIKINFEEDGKDTCRSPRRVLAERRAHCIEGAILAAAALWYHGQRPLLLDLQTVERDYDHTVALFRRDGRWGAISKTNHAVLRYREAVYKNVRELAMSYFHEYFLDDGHKTMRSYSAPFDINKNISFNWLIYPRNLWVLADKLDSSPHYRILTAGAARRLRRADPVEIKAGKIVEWRKTKN